MPEERERPEVKKKSGLTRRSFLATTALAAGTVAFTSIAGCGPAQEGTAAPDSSETSSENSLFNHCCSNCTLQATVREGKLVRTAPKLAPQYKDYQSKLGCVKGHTNPQRIYGTHRVLYPMKQTGERGSDNWERISWDEAFTLMAEKYQAALDKGGVKSAAVWLGVGCAHGFINGNYMGWTGNWKPWNVNSGIGVARFLRYTGVTILKPTFDQAQLYVGSDMLQQPSSSVEDWQHAKTILMWGANPAESQYDQWPWVLKAKENGTRLIAIEPQLSTSAAHADTWLPVRIGSDGALMLAMCNYIIDNDLIDYDFLKTKSVAPLLVKEGGKYLRLSDLGMDPDEGPEDEETGEATSLDSPVVWDEDKEGFVSYLNATNPALNGEREANGVKVRTVYDAAVENIKPFTIAFAAEECGISESQIEELAQTYATNKPSLIVNNWGMEHTYESWRQYFCLPFLASLTGNFGVPGSGYFTGFSGQASTYYKSPVNRNLEDFTVPDPKENIQLSSEYITEITETGTWNGEDLTLHYIMMIYSNALRTTHGSTYLEQAMKKVDFIVCQDHYMTYTAKQCDLVLPVAMYWEREDFTGSMRLAKAVEPAGECKTDFEIMAGFAEKLGYDDLYTKTPEEYLRTAFNTPENIEAGVSYDDYLEHGVIEGEFEYKERIAVETNPLGLTQFYLEDLPPNDTIDYVVPFEDRLPSYKHAAEAYASNPLREKYPLFGMSYHATYMRQNKFNHNPWLDEFRNYEGDPYMRIHETAAAERGIMTGDTVRIYNDHGSVTLKAVLTKGVREDTIIVPHGHHDDEFIDGHPQTLMGLYIDPVASNANFKDWLCQVEKV